jgi:hypothetical protein
MIAAVLSIVCVQPNVSMEEHHFRHFSCGMNLMETSSQIFQCVRMVVQSSLSSLYSASATTLRFVMKCCCSCFGFFSLTYASSNPTHNHSCFTVHYEQMVMSGNQLPTFSERALYTTARCFYSTSVCAIFRILLRFSSFLFMYVPCILYSVLSRPANAQHIYINSILYILNTPTCFDP